MNSCFEPARRGALRFLLAATVAASPVTALVAQDLMGSTSDPRVGLKAGEKGTAGQVLSNMKLISYSQKPAAFDSAAGLSFINSDLAFRGNYVYQGNFSGFMVWDVSNPATPVLVNTTVCPTDQGDPSIYGNLLFVSDESQRGRNDCGKGGVQDGKDRARGVRIFDVSNPAAPKLIKNVQTCRGSHTHTIVPHPTDKGIIYLYVGGSSSVRDSTEKSGCSPGNYPENPNASSQRIDIIKVPLANPEQAEVVTFARIFTGLAPRQVTAAQAASAAQQAAQPPAAAGAPGARRGGGGGRGAGGPGGCHDMTSYPAYNLVAGSCGSHGIMLNVKNPEKPVRIDAVSDSNFSLWHTAIFSNDAKKVVYTDEWGGGQSPRCRATDPQRLGGNTILSVSPTGKMTPHSYFKMLAAQTDQENCVSHNGGLVPVPGRDIMVQGWYQGGVDVFEFTNPDNPIEIAYFDRGPVDSTKMAMGGSWGAYYYNGYIYSSELSRGLDILELTPSPYLSQNEIDAAKLVRMEEYNPQSQPKIVWPAAFPVVRSYLDQLVRSQGLPSARTTAITAALKKAEAATGAARRTELTKLAVTLDADVVRSKDGARVRAMAAAVRDLAAASK